MAINFFRILSAIFVAAFVAGAWAQTYPAKTIRFIVPWPPGGNADVLLRTLTPKLAEGLGQQIVLDNRGGASGNIGAEMAAKSPPDGYTLLYGMSATHSINRSVYGKMPFQESDFVPIIQMSEVPYVLIVHPSLPVRNAKELIALAKAKPDQLSYGSSGSGSINHLAGELFKLMTGTRMVHVPYKGGGPAVIALLSGEVGILFAAPSTVAPQIKAGKLRALAVTSQRHSLAMPDLPTLAESGLPGYEVTSWNGVLVPAGTPHEVVMRLNAEFNKIIQTPDMRQRLIETGNEPVGGEPEKFGRLIQSETAKWTKVVKATNMKVD